MDEEYDLKWYDEPSVSIEEAEHYSRVKLGVEKCNDPECPCNWKYNNDSST